MADMMDTLKGILGDDAEDKIKTALASFGQTGESSSESKQNQLDANSLEYIMKIKNIADELSNPNDARSKLLMSLRPYMRGTRQKGIDNAIRILNLSKFSGLFR